jgi:hypothetical protein
MFSILKDLAIISVAHAQLPLPGVVSPVNSGSTALTFICTVVFRWVFTGALVLAIALALVAAFKFLTSQGDPANTKAAGQMLVFVALGIAVAIFARVLPVIVGSILDKNLNLDPCAGQSTTKQPGT